MSRCSPPEPTQPSTEELPSALEHLAEIIRNIEGNTLAVFLDYDGTLTPIVGRPEAADFPPGMRAAVTRLAGLCLVGVISGRDRGDVASRVGLEELVYAGSHGFDISGPGGRPMECAVGSPFLPALAAAGVELEMHLEGIAGAQLERKKYALAVHFRRVAEEDVERVEAAVAAVAERHRQLRRSGGKKVFELRPDIDWDKGKAVLWLLERLGLDGPGVFPLYIGDDLTDEDAFRALRRRSPGMGIVVRDEVRPTAAHYALEGVGEVELFLRRLTDELTRGKGR